MTDNDITYQIRGAIYKPTISFIKIYNSNI